MQQTVSPDGTTIAYWRSGSGPPLLFVHGATADHNSWDRVSPYLEPNFTVIAMDRRGRGGSGDSANHHFMREVEDVVAVVDAVAGLGGESVNLFGHSWGGLCCLEAALLSDQVGRLILYEPDVPTGPLMIRPDVPDEIQALTDQGNLEAAMQLFMREVVEMPEHELAAYQQTPLWSKRLPLAKTIARELAVYETYRFEAARFAGLEIPVMLLQGGDSPASFRDAIEQLHTSLPDSRIVTLSGQQHIAHHTNPQVLAKEIRTFLTS